MPLTQQELERFLWEQPAECQARGLGIQQDLFSTSRRYQRLDLGPYGVAQLVNVRYDLSRHWYYVQVISCCTGYLTTQVYQQAQRHLAAIRHTLYAHLKQAGITAYISTSSVLVGRQLRRTGDFVYTLSQDALCQAYTYTYGPTGVWFEAVGWGWHIPGAHTQPALTQLGSELLGERERALATQEPARAAWLASLTPELGELSETLVITAAGVVENRGLLEEGQADE